MVDVIGAHTALTRAEQERDRSDRRGKGAWLADTALELLSGRAPGQPQPIEVALVMTDQTLLRGAFGVNGVAPDLAQLPGWGAVPGTEVRRRLSAQERTWLRRLYTSPDGRDLVAMDSKQRRFSGSLRDFLSLRDATCRVPYCDAPAIHMDHATGFSRGADTSVAEGNGQCANHNLTKEEPGWRNRVISDGLGPGPEHQPHEIEFTTPSGQTYRTRAAPIHGWGTHSNAPTISVDPAFEPITDIPA